jgi:phospholipid transport system substrate-binding protein
MMPITRAATVVSAVLLLGSSWAPASADKGQPAPAGAPGTPATGTPMAHVRNTNDRIDKVLKSKKSADDPAAKAEMRSIVNGFLDYNELARKALASHWDGLTPAQRSDFTKTLHEMIEKTYERRLKTDLQYKVSYGDETVKGDDATVSTTLKIKTKGKSTDTIIDYKLKRSGDRWVVYDVVTDDVSMVKTYREQFDKIIKQESFDALLKKMRKRIADTESGGATAPADEKKTTSSSKPRRTPPRLARRR